MQKYVKNGVSSPELLHFYDILKVLLGDMGYSVTVVEDSMVGESP